MSGLPILVEGGAVTALVVGGGAVASRKASALCAAGARVRVVAPRVGEGIRALADAGRVTLVERAWEAGDVGDAELVIAATDHRATNAAVAAEARAAHRLVNVADAAGEGSFSTMATHRAGALVIGVSAGVPSAAARIRDAVAERFDHRYERALRELSALRDTLIAQGQGSRWRTLSDAVIGERFCEQVETETLEPGLASWR